MARTGRTVSIGRSRSARAFTLIEVMLAIAIMAVVCGTIYQFTGTVLRSSAVSMRADDQSQTFAGLRRLLDAQFAALPANETGAFIGVSDEGKHGHRDSLQVVCPAGNALLTPDAHGLYEVTLWLEETPRESGHYVLGMERMPWTDAADRLSSFAVKNPSSLEQVALRPADWVPLLDGVSALEIAYYDPRLNSWQDKWNDDTLIPSLVRVRVTMENTSTPYEFVEQILSGGIRRGLPSTIANATTLAGGGASYALPGTNTVPGVTSPSGAYVPTLPPGLTVPPPPPSNGYPGAYPGSSNSPGFSPGSPVIMPSGGNVVPVPR